jgi:hypothetical protein
VFWDGYGPRPSGAAARRSLYLARHVGAIRLERHRVGNITLEPQAYEQVRDILARLG